MALYLVRHAVAMGRSSWDGDDDDRPLTPKGERQSEALVGLLRDAHIRSLHSSPAVRCVDTLRPLATATRREIQTTGALAEGRGVAKALKLIADLTAEKGDAVVCTHGDVVPEVLRRLARDGLVLEHELQYAKGSTWVLTVDHGKLTSARYLPPPA